MDLENLKASDGTGEAVLAHITSPRTIGSTVLDVDNVDNWSQKFIVTTGTLGANGYITAASMCQMYGHLNSGDIIIDGYCPGYTDVGNTSGQVAIIKQTTSFADLVAQTLINMSGMVIPFAGAAAPSGWLLCDGAAVSRTTYARLFTVIGTTYGAGNGTTTFNLPDARGRNIIGVGTGTFAEVVAAANVTIATDQLTVSAAGGKQLLNGNAVVLTTSGVAPTGLTAGNTYYVVAVDATHIRLATTATLAAAGTYIDITGQGSGNHTLTLSLTARTLAEKGGEEKHVQTNTELSAHTHSIGGGQNQWVRGGSGDNAASLTQGGSAFRVVPGDLDSKGGSGAANVMDPFLALNHIIKT